MIKSMTGFGYREYQDDLFHCVVEIKAVNNRYLDVYVNLPPHMNPLEPKLRDFITREVHRGRVEITVRAKELEEKLEVSLDRSTAEAYRSVLLELAEYTRGVEAEGGFPVITISDLLGLEGIIKTVKTRELDSLWERIEPLCTGAFKDFEKARVQDGEKTIADIRKAIKEIRVQLDIIEARAEEMEEGITKTLRDRFDQVMGDRVDEQRILAETAVLLVRFSLNEELVRLKGHLSEFDRISGEDGPVGKKLDFLCQEINREINTIGSKSTIMEINRAVVEAKNSLENIREHLRNIE